MFCAKKNRRRLYAARERRDNRNNRTNATCQQSHHHHRQRRREGWLIHNTDATSIHTHLCENPCRHRTTELFPFEIARLLSTATTTKATIRALMYSTILRLYTHVSIRNGSLSFCGTVQHTAAVLHIERGSHTQANRLIVWCARTRNTRTRRNCKQCGALLVLVRMLAAACESARVRACARVNAYISPLLTERASHARDVLIAIGKIFYSISIDSAQLYWIARANICTHTFCV